jgi:hypothetical protein
VAASNVPEQAIHDALERSAEWYAQTAMQKPEERSKK